MRRLRPADREAIAPGDEEEPSTDRGRPVVGRPKLAMIDLVTKVFELRLPTPEGLAFPQRARLSVGCDRPPVFELLDVLQDDDARLDRLRPADHDPREAAN